MAKAPGMRYICQFLKVSTTKIFLQVCGRGECSQEEEAEETTSNPRPWQHQVGFRQQQRE